MARGGYGKMCRTHSGKRRVSVLVVQFALLINPYHSAKNTFVLLRVLAEAIGNGYIEAAIDTYENIFTLLHERHS